MDDPLAAETAEEAPTSWARSDDLVVLLSLQVPLLVQAVASQALSLQQVLAVQSVAEMAVVSTVTRFSDENIKSEVIVSNEIIYSNK